MSEQDPDPGATMKSVSVQCRGIGLSYGATEVLKDVNLEIEPGEFYALLGPSGSGKSTLLRLIAGFVRHQRGELLVDGQDLTALEPWERQVGLVFQNYALWPHLTVWDNVAFGLVERRMPKETIRRKVGAALELVGLSSFGERRPGQLSGGQQQRVALARTLVIEPQVLLLDEPLSNLDKTLRVQMRQELHAMQRRLGVTTIFVTHDQEEAMTTADRMAVLEHGVVQQVGTPMELYDEPANAFVAGFVGTTNLLPGSARLFADGSVAVELDGLGTIRLSEAAGGFMRGPVTVALRPGAFVLGSRRAVRDARLAWTEGVVQAAEFLGEYTRYRVQAGGQVLSIDEPHRIGQGRFAPGAEVVVGVDGTQARLMPG
jgi:iron(III) transport system ATP-binding protein